jgi:hypothetical protein
MSTDAADAENFQALLADLAMNVADVFSAVAALVFGQPSAVVAAIVSVGDLNHALGHFCLLDLLG